MMMAIRLLLTRMTQMPLRGATGKNCSRVVTQRRICQKSLGKSPVTRNRRWLGLHLHRSLAGKDRAQVNLIVQTRETTCAYTLGNLHSFLE